MLIAARSPRSDIFRIISRVVKIRSNVGKSIRFLIFRIRREPVIHGDQVVSDIVNKQVAKIDEEKEMEREREPAVHRASLICSDATFFTSIPFHEELYRMATHSFVSRRSVDVINPLRAPYDSKNLFEMS